MKVGKRFTIYDMMEARGVFEQNTANASSPGYKKVEWPKMVYHPEGKVKTVFAGTTSFDPETRERQMVGKQVEIINKLANDKTEYDKLIKEGWHSHPAYAMAASGLESPATTNPEYIAGLEHNLKIMQEQLAIAKKSKLVQAGIED